MKSEDSPTSEREKNPLLSTYDIYITYFWHVLLYPVYPIIVIWYPLSLI